MVYKHHRSIRHSMNGIEKNLFVFLSSIPLKLTLSEHQHFRRGDLSLLFEFSSRFHVPSIYTMNICTNLLLFSLSLSSRVSVIRGQIFYKKSLPLNGVKVQVFNQPQQGFTISDKDGL